MKLPWLDTPWQRFLQRAAVDRMPHAFLVTGPAGIGKWLLAERMARWLLCLTPADNDACGSCRSCQLFRSTTGVAHPERFVVKLLEEKKEIVVDQVRELIEKLNLTTTVSARKVALVQTAERLNRNAANALLKTLEEPPGDTVMVLVCEDASRLPVTVRSRCQLIAVQPPGTDESLQWLQQQPSAGNAEQAKLAQMAAPTGPLMALQLLETGELEHFVEFRRQLEQVHTRPGGVSRAADALSGLDRFQLWRWLSQWAGEHLKATLSGHSSHASASKPRLDPLRLAKLQMRADLHLRLAESPVRQDLLLQEWLLEWSALNRSATALAARQSLQG